MHAMYVLYMNMSYYSLTRAILNHVQLFNKDVDMWLSDCECVNMVLYTTL